MEGFGARSEATIVATVVDWSCRLTCMKREHHPMNMGLDAEEE